MLKKFPQRRGKVLTCLRLGEGSGTDGRRAETHRLGRSGSYPPEGMPQSIIEKLEEGIKCSGGFPPLEASSPQRGVIKPNLINNGEAAYHDTLRDCRCSHEILPRDGLRGNRCGRSGGCETFEVYRELGYLKLERHGVRLVDLNNDDFELVKNSNALFLKEFEFPLTLKGAFIISAA